MCLSDLLYFTKPKIVILTNLNIKVQDTLYQGNEFMIILDIRMFGGGIFAIGVGPRVER